VGVNPGSPLAVDLPAAGPVLYGVAGIGRDSESGLSSFTPLTARVCDLALAEPEVMFKRGDSNGDGAVNLGDAIYTLQYLFVNGPAIACMDAADTNDDENVDISDPLYLLQNLFAGGAAIPPPSPGCGIDATPDPQGKRELPACTYCPSLCHEPPEACP
jgi:hypothetical protein